MSWAELWLSGSVEEQPRSRIGDQLVAERLLKHVKRIWLLAAHPNVDRY